MSEWGHRIPDEAELDVVREELATARDDLRHKEAAPIERRVTDEDRYMVGLLRLQARIRSLEAEEARLVKKIEDDA